MASAPPDIAAARALAQVGLRSASVEAWAWVHAADGEVHCATNVFGAPGLDAAWWWWRRDD